MHRQQLYEFNIFYYEIVCLLLLCFVLFCQGAIPTSSQGLLLALCSNITPDRDHLNLHWMPRIKPGWTTSEARRQVHYSLYYYSGIYLHLILTFQKNIETLLQKITQREIKCLTIAFRVNKNFYLLFILCPISVQANKK